jgi:sucrose phosphorylase
VADVAGDPDQGTLGLLPPEAIDAVVQNIHQRSAGESRLASGSAAQNVDAYQINCTFYDALGQRDDEYLVARAIQCFVPGIPQVYYMGLLAGTNDLELLRRTGVGRDINRRYYSAAGVHDALQKPVVQSLLALLRLRHAHAAFDGRFHVDAPRPGEFALIWEREDAFARLDVDLPGMRASVSCSPGAPASLQTHSDGAVWRSWTVG